MSDVGQVFRPVDIAAVVVGVEIIPVVVGAAPQGEGRIHGTDVCIAAEVSNTIPRDCGISCHGDRQNRIFLQCDHDPVGGVRPAYRRFACVGIKEAVVFPAPCSYVRGEGSGVGGTSGDGSAIANTSGNWITRGDGGCREQLSASEHCGRQPGVYESYLHVGFNGVVVS
jgi:hypothetical protein